MQVNLKQMRSNAGLSQRQAAETVGVNLRTWQRWEAGTNNPPAAAVELFCKKIKHKLNEGR